MSLGGAGHLDLLYHLVRTRRPEWVLETGVASGWSSLAILLGMENNRTGTLVSIDRPDMQLPDDNRIGDAVPDRLRARWRVHLGVDRDRLPEALTRIPAGTLGLVHYDSDKSYYGRAWAYRLIWQHLKPGGLLVSDDIGDNEAFRDFALAVGRAPLVLLYDTAYVGVLEKR